MLVRQMVRNLGTEMPAQAGLRVLSGLLLSAVDGANQTITAAAVIAGIVNRTGSGGATADVMPTVDLLLAALPDLSRGDSFNFFIRMPDANAITLTAGAGMTGVGTINVAASNIRQYLLTLTSDNKRTRVVSATTTNTTLVLTNVAALDLANIGVGMAVTGTGIGASAKVTAINYATGAVSVSVASTATANSISVTFTPQMDLLGFSAGAI